MRIEQRIGRCHRYGQEHDVVAINLINTQNAADQRVYEILSKKFELFEGVLAHRILLLEHWSLVRVLKRWCCRFTRPVIPWLNLKAFDKLDRKLNAKRDNKTRELRSILLTESSSAKEQSLNETKDNIDRYLQDVEYWSSINEPEVDSTLHYWKVDNWGSKF